jgi:hypothetical protein
MLNSAITKRQLGLVFLAAGILGFAGIIVLNIVRPDDLGIGPAQVLGMAGCAALFVVGCTLLPLGDRPA